MSKRAPHQLEHNDIFAHAIGRMIVNWSNTEGNFLLIFCAIMYPNMAGSIIIWHSLRTAKARMDLLWRVVRARIADDPLLEDMGRAISNFGGLSRNRNFFCHAVYDFNSDGEMVRAGSLDPTHEGDPIIFKNRNMDKGTLNQINDTARKLNDLSRSLDPLQDRVESYVGCPSIKQIVARG